MKIIENLRDFKDFISLLWIFLTETFISLIDGKREEHIINFIKRTTDNNIMYIKLFQALAGSRDILTEKLSNYILQFSDEVPYDINHNEEFDDLSKKIEKINEKYNNLKITDITKEPIKSGSISIVYGGKLNNDVDIVIKVLRKNAKKDMIKAIKHCKIVSKIMNMIKKLRYVRFDKVITENEDILLEQLNFSKEVLNNKLFYENNKKRSWVKIPYVYEEFTNEFNDIIVMERLYGKYIEELKGYENDIYARLFSLFVILSIIKDRVYHSDLHRGNILFIKNEISNETNIDYNFVLGILDYGIIGTLTNDECNNITDFYYYLAQEDYESAVKVLLNDIVNKNNNFMDENTKLISNLVEIAKKSKRSFGASEFIEINHYLMDNNISLGSEFCKIELAMAMGVSVTKCLESENKTYTEYIYESIREIMDLDMFDV